MMRIIEQNSDRLILREQPWLLSGLLVLFTIAVAYGLVTSWAEEGWGVRGVLLFWTVILPFGLHYFVHWVRIDFDRLTGRIDILRRGLLFESRRSWPLKRLARAQLQEMRDEGVTTRVVLVFDQAMLSEMDPGERQRLARLKARGFRQAAPNEVPLAGYFSGGAGGKSVAGAINRWIGAAS